jgi:hypothetical protein
MAKWAAGSSGNIADRIFDAAPAMAATVEALEPPRRARADATTAS